jgi:succinate dehydrogenase/fumarate reductase cytochrome b subunit
MKTFDDAKWMKWQALSGAMFALFLFVHLINQMLAALGQQTYDGYQVTMRKGYQAPVLEIVLVLAPLLAHAVCGVVRVWKRRSREAQTPVSWRVRLHRYSGYFLLLFFIGHVGATRGASYFYGAWPGFSGVAFTFTWVPAYFWPYYTLLALSGWYHLVHGLSVALPVLGVKSVGALHRPAVFNTFVAAGSLALIIGVLSLGGVFFDVGDVRSSEYVKLVLRLTSSQ